MRKKIVAAFPADYSKLLYVEVFGGAGWVLQHKDISRAEVFNDINGDLVNLFRVIRDQYEEFQRVADWTFQSREMFEEAKHKLRERDFKDELDRALTFAIVQVQSLGGKGLGADSNISWGLDTTHTRRNNKWLAFREKLLGAAERFRRVRIENKNYDEVIKIYDKESTLFYLDPPYYGTESYYNKGATFTKDDHVRLLNILRGIKGKFVLSYYEVDEIKELYSDFHITTHKARQSLGLHAGGKDKGTKELLITNYDATQEDASASGLPF